MALTAATALLDFGCCFHGTAYRDELVLRNNSAATVKAAVAVPEAAAHLLSVAPKFAFIQAHSELAFSVTLCGGEDAVARSRRFVTDADASALRVPLKITCPGQRLAPEVAVSAQLTTPQLAFEPEALALGRCVLHEGKCAPLRIHNRSALPQTFAICELPPGVEVQPLDGLGTIAPCSAVDVEVRYTPTLAGRQRLQLCCKTLALGTFSLHCTAEAVALPLRLEQNRFEMAATAVGDCTVVSTTLVNASKQRQGFHFVPPPESGVSVTPTSGQLAAGERVRVQVEFAPAAAVPSTAAAEESADDAQPACEARRESMQAADAAPSSAPPSLVNVVHVPCFVQGCTDERGAQSGLQLTLRTCTVPPRVELLDAPFDGERRRYVHDFGAQPIGSRGTAAFSFRNCSQQDVQLCVDALDPLGPFELAAALRTVPAGGTGRIRLQFRPRQDGPCLEVVELRAPGQTLRLQLSGTGVAPRVVVQDAGEPAALHFGDVATGDEARRTFKLHNPCPFDLVCECRFAGLCPRNLGSVPPFYASLETVAIAAGATVDVAASFQPDFQVRCYHALKGILRVC